MTTKFILLVICFILSAFSSASETAYTAVSMMDLDLLSVGQTLKGKSLQFLFRRPDRILTTLLIANNFANISASIITAQISISLWESLPLATITAILTFFILIFCEIIPKQTAISTSTFICSHSVYIVLCMEFLLYPVIFLLEKVIPSVSSREEKQHVSLQGLFMILQRAQKQGVFNARHSQVVRNAMNLSQLTARSIITHRSKVFSLPCITPLGDALPQIIESEFSRIPVYKETPEHMVGIVHIRALLGQMNNPSTLLSDIMYEPLFVPHHRKIHLLIDKMLKEGSHMALILDDYGGFLGIVVLEDILEEIIGEIYDEHESPEIDAIIKLPGDRYSIRADIPLTHLASLLPEDIQEIKVQTLGGYLYTILGRIPTNREKIQSPLGEFTVSRMEKNRIVRVSYTPRQATR